MKIGIVTAMTEEFRAVAACSSSSDATRGDTPRLRRFCSNGHDVVLVRSGIGFDNAAEATHVLIRDERPELIISTGYCGAILPGLRAGDVVVAENMAFVGDCCLDEIPAELAGVGRTLVARQAVEGSGIFSGTFISSREVLSKKDLARLIRTSDHNPVVEMESGAIALIAAEQGVPLLALRAVSDTADEELSFSITDFCRPDMKEIDYSKVLLTTLRRPAIIPQLLRLSRSSRCAATAITTSLSRLLPLL